MPDFLPRPDGDFAAWANHYVDRLQDWWAAHGLDTDDLIALKDALSVWNESYPAHVAAQAAAEAARSAKDAARAALVEQIRPTARIVQAYPDTTNAERAKLGITIREGFRGQGSGFSSGGGTVLSASSRSGGGGGIVVSASSRSAAGLNPPTSRPLITVATPARYTHALRLFDEQAPTRRARPRGVARAELFVAFTPTSAAPPADPQAYRYVQSVSDGSAVLSFDPPQGGLQAHYLARWVTHRGALGPWSETASATVAA